MTWRSIAAAEARCLPKCVPHVTCNLADQRSLVHPRATRSLVAAGLLVSCLLFAGPAIAADEIAPDEPTAEQVEFFEKQIRPILVSKCQDCHGEDAAESGLRVDSLAALLAGGERGPAIVPGKPDESLLISAVQHGELLQMPPKEKLAKSEISNLQLWIKQSAFWPGENASAAAAAAKAAKSQLGEVTDEDRQFWSFQPVVKPEPPPVKNEAWVQSPIDRFILAKLETAGITPAPAASRPILLRRITFDLTGLPPTPADIDAFVSDDKPGALERVIDRLLASPAYGERWGRHWLDVARYADSNGMDENLAFEHAWRYRDYVIDAFNRDLPYDQFLIEQLAGDLMPPSETTPISEKQRRITATGFLSVGPKMLADDDPVKKEMDIIDEQLDTLSKAFLGMTVACARCHDHKFDPIPTADYYSLAGIFKSTKTMENFGVVASWHEHTFESETQQQERIAYEQKQKDLKAETEKLNRTAEERIFAAEQKQAGKYLLAASKFVSFAKSEVASDAPASDPTDSLLQGKPEEVQKQALIFEAENYDRGTILKAGSFIQNGGDASFLNEAEYDFKLEKAGSYQIELMYASGEPRKVRLYVGSSLVNLEAANQTTGGFDINTARWFNEGVISLPAGEVTLRIEYESAIPHFDKVALVPTDRAVNIKASVKPVATSLAEYAKQHDLARDQLERWSSYLSEQLQTAPDFWKPWIEWQAAGASEEQAATLAAEFQSKIDRVVEFTGPIHPRFKPAKPITEVEEALRPVYALLVDKRGPIRLPKDFKKQFTREEKEGIDVAQKSLKELEENKPEITRAMGVSEGKPQNVRIHLRGSHTTLGAEVPRQFLRVVATENQPIVSDGSSGRLELAQWMASPQHPLTSRVIANRVWRWHLGTGIVKSVDNFGTLGDLPTHPELLDWLASRLVEHGWSLKALHREILLSSTYQMSSTYSEASYEADPENKLYWRWTRRRLEAEEVRDSLMFVSDRLDAATGGSLMKFRNRDYVTGTGSRVNGYDNTRRSVYLPVLRSAVYEVLQAFDFADPSALEGNRATTTVTPQALFMMNSEIVSDSSKALAEKLIATQTTDEARVDDLFQRSLARLPTDSERSTFTSFAQKLTADLKQADEKLSDEEATKQAWRSVTRVIMSSSEFIYVE